MTKPAPSLPADNHASDECTPILPGYIGVPEPLVRCYRCREARPASLYAGRHRVCTPCRTKADTIRRRSSAYQRRRTAIDGLPRAIGRAETLLGVVNIATAYADTDLAGLGRMIGDQLADTRCTSAQRLKITRMLFHMDQVATIATRKEEQANANVDPEAMMLQFHADRRLVPFVRRMLAEGTISLDDIDPPAT